MTTDGRLDSVKRRRVLRIALLVVAAMASLGPVTAAQTETVHVAASTALLDQILTGMEIEYEMAWDDEGSPTWIFTHLGILITLAAYDEAAQGQYASLLFFAGWAVDGAVSLADINEWNRASRFGRAYVDETGDPAVELDLLRIGGVTAQTIREYIDLFVATASDLGVNLEL